MTGPLSSDNKLLSLFLTSGSWFIMEKSYLKSKLFNGFSGTIVHRCGLLVITYVQNFKQQFKILNYGKLPYFQNSFLWLIDYISFNIDTTYTYYISNNWKLSQDFAELLQYELRYLREELWAHEQFSFFPPRPYGQKIC